jgi:hypothetical protein
VAIDWIEDLSFSELCEISGVPMKEYGR